MKKSKLSLSLVSAFIASLSMSSCSDVTSNKTAFVTFTGYDGQSIAVISNDLYHDYINSSSGVSVFYNAMLEVLIRYEFEDSNSVLRKISAQYEASGDEDKQISSITTIKSNAKEKLAGYQKEAKQNAASNNTSYDTEWEDILTDNGVESEEEFLQKLIYDAEKDEVEDWYYNVNEESLLAEYIGVDASGNPLSDDDKVVSSKYPYHIRHILASLSSGSSDYYDGTITESEASTLGNITKALVDGKLSFGNIALQFSGDESSAALNGSVGIMDLDTSFVSEFKLGIYAYDAIYSNNSEEDVSIAAGLGLEDEFSDTGLTVAQQLEEIGLAKVPYEAFQKIAETYDTDTDAKGRLVNDGNTSYFPRNIYYNKYLNHHNVFVITNNSIDENLINSPDGEVTSDTTIDESLTEANEGSCGFRSVENVTEGNQMILTDENGNPIVCVRGEYGIHFMIIEKSIFASDVDAYYSTLTPDDSDYDADADTYVNFVGGNDKSVYIERADEIVNLIKGFDSTYDYRLYEYFLAAENGKVSFHTDSDSDAILDLAASIEKYIETQRTYNDWNSSNDLNESWDEYLELIELQQQYRTEVYADTNTTEEVTRTRLMPEMCALKYSNGIDDEIYQEGGLCYYYAK